MSAADAACWTLTRRTPTKVVDGDIAAKLAKLKGVLMLVNQWASWCPNCKQEFPYFQQLARTYVRQVAFVGLDSQDQRDDAEAFLRGFPVTYPSLFDPGADQARSIGGGQGWPTTFFYDRTAARPTRARAATRRSPRYGQTSSATPSGTHRDRPAAGVGVLAALAAGAVSFLSPCVLPLVPAYLSAVVGVAPADLEHAGARRVLPPSLAFVASFSLIFILLGLGATTVGSALRDHHDTLDKVAAAVIVAMGVYFVASAFVARLNRTCTSSDCSRGPARVARSSRAPRSRSPGRRASDRSSAPRRSPRPSGTPPFCWGSTRPDWRSRFWRPHWRSGG